MVSNIWKTVEQIILTRLMRPIMIDCFIRKTRFTNSRHHSNDLSSASRSQRFILKLS